MLDHVWSGLPVSHVSGITGIDCRLSDSFVNVKTGEKRGCFKLPRGSNLILSSSFVYIVSLKATHVVCEYMMDTFCTGVAKRLIKRVVGRLIVRTHNFSCSSFNRILIPGPLRLPSPNFTLFPAEERLIRHFW